jgi:hypothetical protein
VRTERHTGKLQQATVDASLIVCAVDAPPLPIDDIRPLTRVAQRCGCRRERGILGQRERALCVDRQTLTAAAGTAALCRLEPGDGGFFSDQLVEHVTGLYGVRPTVTHLEFAELIDNE